jgi:hypothetical protein
MPLVRGPPSARASAHSERGLACHKVGRGWNRDALELHTASASPCWCPALSVARISACRCMFCAAPCWRCGFQAPGAWRHARLTSCVQRLGSHCCAGHMSAPARLASLTVDERIPGAWLFRTAAVLVCSRPTPNAERCAPRAPGFFFGFNSLVAMGSIVTVLWFGARQARASRPTPRLLLPLDSARTRARCSAPALAPQRRLVKPVRSSCRRRCRRLWPAPSDEPWSPALFFPLVRGMHG